MNLNRFSNRDNISDIAQAKRTAERFGYRVELDDDESFSRIQRPHRYNFTKPEDKVATALRTATDAGLTVRRMSDVEQAAQVARDNGFNIVRKVASRPRAVERPKTANDNYLARAQHFMYDEDN